MDEAEEIENTDERGRLDAEALGPDMTCEILDTADETDRALLWDDTGEMDEEIETDDAAPAAADAETD